MKNKNLALTFLLIVTLFHFTRSSGRGAPNQNSDNSESDRDESGSDTNQGTEGNRSPPRSPVFSLSSLGQGQPLATSSQATRVGQRQETHGRGGGGGEETIIPSTASMVGVRQGTFGPGTGSRGAFKPVPHQGQPTAYTFRLGQSESQIISTQARRTGQTSGSLPPSVSFGRFQRTLSGSSAIGQTVGTLRTPSPQKTDQQSAFQSLFPSLPSLSSRPHPLISRPQSPRRSPVPQAPRSPSWSRSSSPLTQQHFPNRDCFGQPWPATRTGWQGLIERMLRNNLRGFQLEMALVMYEQFHRRNK